MNILKNALILSIFGVYCAFAQVKIGDNPGVIDNSSILELESNSRAFVLSRVTTAEMQAISPLRGAIVHNIDDSCIYHYDGGQWKSLCASSVGFSFVDNEDGTFTLNSGNGTPVTFDGAPDTISTLVDNGDGTYIYTNEAGANTTIVSDGSGGLSITDNGDGTFTVDDGVNPLFDFDGAPETLSTLVNDGGTFTYMDESGTETSFFIGGATGQHFGASGSVFFANNTTGEPTEAVGEFVWDNVAKRLEIVTTPGAIGLEVVGTTRSQRVSSGSGAASFPGYHFVDSFNSGMFALTPPSSDIGLASGGQEVVRISTTPAPRVGINIPAPLATLHVGGDLIVDGTITNGAGTSLVSKSNLTSKAIRRISADKAKVTELDDTIVLEEAVKELNIPIASLKNVGKILIIKDLGGAVTNLNLPYRDIGNEEVLVINKPTVLWLQSDGKEWQQIN